MSQHSPTYCPNCGARFELREMAGRERPVCPDCGYIYYHNPVPGVGVIIELDGGVVLIQRGHPPHAERWTLPGGFMEADETVEEAAIREAKEETGLDIALQEMVGVFSFPDGPPTSGIIVFYRAKVVGGDLVAGDDAAGAKVFAPADLPELPFRTHREAIEQWLARQQVQQDERRRVERGAFYIREALGADIHRILELAALIPGTVQPELDFRRVAWRRLVEDPALTVFVAETRTADSQRFPGAFAENAPGNRRQNPATPEPPMPNQEPDFAAIIGFTAMSRFVTLTRSLGWIDAMAVDPAFRRMGVGAALMEAALRRAARWQLAEVFVNTENASEVALAFYRSTGFQEGRITRLRLR